MIRLPGLIDIHVHLREPGAIHKEDWESGTAAALAGGYTAVLAMPNTDPPIIDAQSLSLSLSSARKKAMCDYAQFLGAGPDNFKLLPKLGKYAAGLKMYLDQTYGHLRLDEMFLWMNHFRNWPRNLPIAVHAEGRTLAAVILLAYLYDRALHVCHVSLEEEILLIKHAKNRGFKITCEVTPHHLFLTYEDISSIGEGRSEVRPCLAAPSDRDALWENLEIIDCFATDHAPHTLSEKDSTDSPPGFPGLETALPLLLNAIKEGRLTLDGIVERLYTNPCKLFNLPKQSDTWIEVDLNETWRIEAKHFYTRCAWTPFEGASVSGRVRQVNLHGQSVFLDGRILVSPGYGSNLRPTL
jgi:carbamoyl-phosphate synthase/aspartate carbamoyltransferase/dihydroorotase